MTITKIIPVASLLLSGLYLTACAPVIVGGAATGAVVANDRRTTGTFVEDEAIELKIKNAILANKALNKQTHINVTSFNTNVLLTGEAVTEESRNQVIKIARDTEKVSHVFNEITIAAPSAMVARSSDTLLTTNVKSRLLLNKDVAGSKIKVVTEAGVVYLMGLVTRSQGNTAAKVASQASGVQKVVKLFEYID